LYGAYQKDEAWLAAHPGQVPPDPRTGRASLDHAKPIYAIAGSPICPSEAEVDAFRKRAPNSCERIPSDWPVANMERRGFLDPVYRVRFIGMGAKVIEAWIPYEGLRN
jgi:hypothetical protein